MDVKHREDFKHVKQKIKKLDDKLEKVSQQLVASRLQLIHAS